MTENVVHTEGSSAALGSRCLYVVTDFPAQVKHHYPDTEMIQGVFDKGYHYNLNPAIIGYVVFQWVGKVPASLKNDTLKRRALTIFRKGSIENAEPIYSSNETVRRLVGRMD